MWSKDSVSDNINKGIILNMVCTVPDVADENYILPGSCMGQHYFNIYTPEIWFKL